MTCMAVLFVMNVYSWETLYEAVGFFVLLFQGIRLDNVSWRYTIILSYVYMTFRSFLSDRKSNYWFLKG